MYIVFFVLDDPSNLDEVLQALEEIGITGVTVIESTGINRLRTAGQVGAPFMAGINRLISGDVENHYTLFTLVRGKETVDRCIQAIESVTGDLDNPHTGVLAAWPLEIVKGVPGAD